MQQFRQDSFLEGDNLAAPMRDGEGTGGHDEAGNVDLDDGILHVWQDGRSALHVTGVVRPLRTYCQWHWGLYASGDNDDLVLHEDDFTLHRLHEPWTDWAREPWLGEGGTPTCP